MEMAIVNKKTVRGFFSGMAGVSETCSPMIAETYGCGEFVPLIQMIRRTDVSTVERRVESKTVDKKQGMDESDKCVKWRTLEHNGVVFPPEYVRHNVKMLYDGEEVMLSSEAEEVATFFASVLGTDYGNNPVFQKNFFQDFREILRRDGNDRIVDFSKCDFSRIVEYLERQKEQRRNRTKEEKEMEKREKEKITEEYGYCMLDGKREKVGNFRVEPPGLFRGRGNHPKMGCLKKRVRPEQVTLNLGVDAKIPDPPPGTHWGNIVHDNTVTWLASWIENVNGETKYVFLAAGSRLKTESDMKKFEQARALKKVVHKVRKMYMKDIRSKEMDVKQKATACWFIDNLALRAGNEKGEDEADTVGCCSLRMEHVKLEDPCTITFDFLGKDSIRYYNRVEIPKNIFRNMVLFLRGKKNNDLIFDRVTTRSLNKYLDRLSSGLSAKVFRTFNASFTFQKEVIKTGTGGTISEKILEYNRANRQVAILCNHQRAVPKTHTASMERLLERIRDLKYELQLILWELGNRRGEMEVESEVDEEFMEARRQIMEVREKEKMQKMEDVEKKRRTKAGLSEWLEERLEKRKKQLRDKIRHYKTMMIDRDEGKQTALGTSKINYIDPRISVAWCRQHGVPIEKIFNRSLREKFQWAMDVDARWEF